MTEQFRRDREVLELEYEPALDWAALIAKFPSEPFPFSKRTALPTRECTIIRTSPKNNCGATSNFNSVNDPIILPWTCLPKLSQGSSHVARQECKQGKHIVTNMSNPHLLALAAMAILLNGSLLRHSLANATLISSSCFLSGSITVSR